MFSTWNRDSFCVQGPRRRPRQLPLPSDPFRHPEAGQFGGYRMMMRQAPVRTAAAEVQRSGSVVGTGWGGHHSNLRQTCRLMFDW